MAPAVLAVVEGVEIDIRLERTLTALLLGEAVEADAERHAVDRVGLDADGRDLPVGRSLPFVVLAHEAGVRVGLVAVDGLVATDEAGVAPPRFRLGDRRVAVVVEAHGIRTGTVAVLVPVGDHVTARLHVAGRIRQAEAGHVDLHIDVGLRPHELEDHVLGRLDAPRRVEVDGGLEVMPLIVVRGRLLSLPVHGDVVFVVGGVAGLGLDLEAIFAGSDAGGGGVGADDAVLGQHDLGRKDVVDAGHQAALEPGDLCVFYYGKRRIY